MPKRFTDTEKWKDPWYRQLKPVEKCAWTYVLDNCDNAGIYKVDLDLMAFCIGCDVEDLNGIVDKFNSRVRVLDKEKWFIEKFIKFQYGVLSEDCKPHKPVIERLKNLNLYKGYQKGIDTLKEKEQEKVKEKVKEKEQPDRFKKPSPDEVREYALSIDFDLDGNEFCDFYESKDWMIGKSKMKNWKAAVRTWKTKRQNDIPKESVPTKVTGEVDWERYHKMREGNGS